MKSPDFPRACASSCRLGALAFAGRRLSEIAARLCRARQTEADNGDEFGNVTPFWRSLLNVKNDRRSNKERRLRCDRGCPEPQIDENT